jgi:hypothetical protein
MDDEEGVSGPVDAVAPWTIKAVSTATRNAVIVAARKEGLTVGQWIERRVTEWTADGSPVRVDPGQPGSALALTRVSPAPETVSPPPEAPSDLAAVERVAASVAALAGAGVPISERMAGRIVGALARQLPPTRTPTRRPRTNDGSDDDTAADRVYRG